MKALIRFVLISLSVLIITACGGGSNGNSSSNISKKSPQKRTITGYVIDDPVQGATIEVYDLNGNLLAKEENATDKDGKFSISIPNNYNYYLLQSKNGYINNRYYEFVLRNLITKDDLNKTLYITPYSELIIKLLEKKNIELTKKNLDDAKNIIKSALGIDNL